MVHRRLAIIDLSDAGAQPMRDGELDDRLQRLHLQPPRAARASCARSATSSSRTSDTEVLLKGWREWGEDLPEPPARACSRSCCATARAHGPGAATGSASSRCTWPRPTARCAPPRRCPALLAAGGVDTRVDPVALHHYLSWHSVVPAPRTILRGVAQAAAGDAARDRGRRRVRDDRVYWDPPFERTLDVERLAGRACARRCSVAVRRRMVADVPVGILLSRRAGLEPDRRAARPARARRGLATFSIGFEGADEFEFSDLVAREFGTDHHQMRIGRRAARRTRCRRRSRR